MMTTNKFAEYCIRVLGKVNPGSTFLSIRGYHNNFSEVANFSVVFHASYFNAVRKAQTIINKVKYPDSQSFSKKDMELAREELLASFDDTLSGYNPLYTCHGVYKEVMGEDGNPLAGTKLHIRQGIVHINALKVRKRVISPGIYNKSNSSPKTIAKRYLRSITPLNNWVQFKLQPKRFDRLVVERMTIKG
jgi:hypothetical protein